MVGARVVVVESGTDKCKGTDKGLRGVISAVSKQCYYIAHEKKVIQQPSSLSSSSSPSASTPSSSSSASIASPTIILSTSSTIPSSSSSLSLVTSQPTPPIFDDEGQGEGVKEGQKWKEVIWVNKVMVRRVLKSTSVLAVLLPVENKHKKRKRDNATDNGEGDESEKGRICLLYGKAHMKYTVAS